MGSTEDKKWRCMECGEEGRFGLAVWQCSKCGHVYCSDHAKDFQQNIYNWDAETASCPDCDGDMKKVSESPLSEQITDDSDSP